MVVITVLLVMFIYAGIVYTNTSNRNSLYFILVLKHVSDALSLKYMNGQKRYFDKTQHANFWGNPPFQATNQHPNNRETLKNEMKGTYV